MSFHPRRHTVHGAPLRPTSLTLDNEVSDFKVSPSVLSPTYQFNEKIRGHLLTVDQDGIQQRVSGVQQPCKRQFKAANLIFQKQMAARTKFELDSSLHIGERYSSRIDPIALNRRINTNNMAKSNQIVQTVLSKNDRFKLGVNAQKTKQHNGLMAVFVVGSLSPRNA